MENVKPHKELHIEFINAVRANHALEHATFHVLEEKGNKAKLAGFSDAGGFWVLGNVSADTLLESAHEGLQRLQSGEASLALHENCGTNLAATGVIVGGMAWLGMLGVGRGFFRKIGRLPIVILLASLGVLIAQPVGPMVQERLTTLPNGQKREVFGIQRYGLGEWTLQRVRTRLA